MPILRFLDTSGILRANDVEAIKPINPTTGRFDNDKSDYLQVNGNGAALVGANRAVDLQAGNDDAAVTSVHLRLLAKGGGVMLPKLTTAARPAWNAALKGLLIHNTTTDKMNFYGASAIEVVTSA
ncbi:MAG: hypothetical protein LW822_10310 [Phycisphaeraceae bacterium]|jgi:hypothetical protein|nr:hypothetical protein [Phycisphaeraceae bacterium]